MYLQQLVGITTKKEAHPLWLLLAIVDIADEGLYDLDIVLSRYGLLLLLLLIMMILFFAGVAELESLHVTLIFKRLEAWFVDVTNVLILSWMKPMILTLFLFFLM